MAGDRRSERGDRVIVTGLAKSKPGAQVKAQEVTADDKQQAAAARSQNKPSLNLNRSR
jgi:membrane fusion protein (multidrug efflux system)